MAEDVQVSVEGAREVLRPPDDRLVLACAQGHRWEEHVRRLEPVDCPHGLERGDDGGERPAQVDLVCRSCGAGLAVVGRVGRRECPRCGQAMTCPRCLAGGSEEQPREARCPRCGGPPAAVLSAPAVTFRGAVTKTIGGM